MAVVTGGLAPLRTGGFFGTRRTITEKKTVDVNATNINLVNTESVTLLNGIATGTDFTDRVGRKVILKSLFIRWAVVPQDQTVTDNTCRMCIVYDSQTNGAAPTYSDVFKEGNPLSQLNLNNRDRFQVLWDKCIQMSYLNNTATQALSGNKTVANGKKFKPLKHEMIFGGTAATVSSIQTGSIYLICLGSAVANAGHVFAFTSRIRFVDA